MRRVGKHPGGGGVTSNQSATETAPFRAASSNQLVENVEGVKVVGATEQAVENIKGGRVFRPVLCGRPPLPTLVKTPF